MKQKKVFLLLNGEPPKEMPNLSNYDIILASQSPRRINFFNELNIKFKSLKSKSPLLPLRI